MMVPVELREIQIVDDSRQSQVLVLGEKNGPREFQIYIHLVEAAAIDNAVRGQVAPRPLTHDLILNAIAELGAKLIAVQVDDLKSDTFFGKLVLETKSGQQVLVDARPSDSMVLAAKTRAPIFVADHVLAAVCREPGEADGPADEGLFDDGPADDGTLDEGSFGD
jgi:bifunctional DNase/RNase